MDYANSLGQYFVKLSLIAATCKAADNTESVRISKEPEVKHLKKTNLANLARNCATLENG